MRPDRLPNERDPHQLFGLALAFYRAAQWEQALTALQQSVERDPAWSWRTWPLRAMIHHRLGRADQARKDLAEARDRLERHQVEVRKSDRPLFDGNWFDYEILYREADSLVGTGQDEPRRPAQTPRS
jgi:tetratricopeptide (TPR) repeat protein